jgi:hypothetical protein
MPTPLIPDMAVFQRKLTTLPVVTYRAGRRRSKRQRNNGASSKQQCYCSHELFSRYGLTFRRGFTCSQASEDERGPQWSIGDVIPLRSRS